MNSYYATFIPGLQNFIAGIIKERLADVKIRKLLDGAVLFETETSYDKLNFFCFNNIFACLSVMEHTKSSASLEKHIRAIIKNSGSSPLSETPNAKEIIASNAKNFRTFRIVVSSENIPTAIDEKLRADIEVYIRSLSGLKINRSRPDTEFWFLFRREKDGQEQNFSVFMKRLTLRPSWEKTLHKGELPPPLAWSLCHLAKLAHGQIVLDPFCGYGSIPEAAVKHFHITNFIACDSDRQAADYTAERFKKRKNSGFVLYNDDFCELPSLIGEKSIDTIVTDPPWGHYRETGGSRFYEKMFDVFAKLLKENGRAVVLCANKEELLKAVPECFDMQDSVPVLLSGKKTVIFQFYFKKNTRKDTEQ